MNQTRRLTIIAVMAAIAFILMVFAAFPLIPVVSFLKIDLSFIPIFIGALMLDLKSGYVILLIRTLLKLLLNNAGVNDMIGLPMNVIGFGVLLTVLYIFVKKGNWRQTTLGVGLGTLALTLSMLILNYFFAIPLYAKFANFDISATLGLQNYMVGAVLPFNLLEGLILSVLGLIVYSLMRKFITTTNQAMHS
ncbi:MAG: ECF transporter S component [Lactobacillaceae bacterium]|jgi:riboflavin transporter FmnP|nr:ECF transporter S component [Lactobacillaceae bacterium]